MGGKGSKPAKKIAIPAGYRVLVNIMARVVLNNKIKARSYTFSETKSDMYTLTLKSIEESNKPDRERLDDLADFIADCRSGHVFQIVEVKFTLYDENKKNPPGKIFSFEETFKGLLLDPVKDAIKGDGCQTTETYEHITLLPKGSVKSDHITDESLEEIRQMLNEYKLNDPSQ